MGRPIHKKYFGNTNTPPITGESVSSVTVVTQGLYTTRATVSFSTPTSPGGVQAVGNTTMEVESVTAIGGTMTGYTVGQLLTINGAGGAIVRVASIGGTGGDDVLTVDFTGGSRGELAAALPTGARTTTSNGAGAGATLTLRWRVKSVNITTAGSGYVSVADAVPTFSNGVGGAGDAATGTAVLTSTNQNSILVTADTGNGDAAADIIKQVSSRRYKVTDGTTTLVCKLAASGSLAVGEMSIVATDSDTNEYYVTKLTAHRALLTRKALNGSAYEFATGASVPWNLTGAVVNTSVKVANA